MAPRPMEVTIGRGLTLYVQELARTGHADEAQAWCSCHPGWQVRIAVCDGPRLVGAEDPVLTLLRGEAYEAHKAAR